jgi:hypothetical protein
MLIDIRTLKESNMEEQLLILFLNRPTCIMDRASRCATLNKVLRDSV